jgi:hypothetical protein
VKKAFVLGLVLMCTGVVATQAVADGDSGRPVNGAGSGQTVTVPTGPATFASTSTGTVAVAHFGTWSYTLQATQDWSAATWPGNPCAVVAGTVTYVASGGSATATATVAGKTCELLPFDNTKYSSSLVETFTGGTGSLGGASGKLTLTGLSTATSVAGTFADTFTIKGTVKANRGGGNNGGGGDDGDHGNHGEGEHDS